MNGKMRDYALKKPVAITADGKFVLPADVAASLSLGVGSLHSLDTALQQKLTLQRIKLDPKYDLGLIGLGKFTKSEVIAHVESQTEVGRTVMMAEMNYCNEFAARTAEHLGKQSPQLPHVKPSDVTLPPWKPKAKKIKLWIKNTALFCEDTLDGVAGRAAAYRIKYVHPVFKARMFNVISLEDINDIRANFVPQAKNPRTVYISGVGHGNPTVYTGYNGNHILEVGQYDPAEVKGKVIHLLSCQTAKQLGKDVVAQGARAYTGYFENFTFVWDDQNTPLNEELLFWKCDSTFDIAIAQGASVAAACEVTIATYNWAIAQVPNTSAATWLTWDRNYFRSPVSDAAYGNKNARVPNMTAIWVTIPLAISELAATAERVEV